MPELLRRATPGDLATILADLPAYWDDRDVRHLHHPMFVREFGDTAFVSGAVDGYLFGFVAPAHIGYIHAVAVHRRSRGSGLGARLHDAFAAAARARGATRLKAITGPANVASIRFHERLGFAAALVVDYSGPGEHRVVLSREL
jgi:ribosomal protein S18 acetylase RimI-like enzyme